MSRALVRLAPLLVLTAVLHAQSPEPVRPSAQDSDRARVAAGGEAAAASSGSTQDESRVAFRGKEGFLSGTATLTPARLEPGGRAELTLSFEVAEGRWGYAAVDAGAYAQPTALKLPEGSPFRLVGTPRETEPKLKKAVEEWEADSRIHEGAFEVTWTLEVAAEAPPGPQELAATLSYQTCDASSCLPDEIALALPFAIVTAAAADPADGAGLADVLLAAINRLGSRLAKIEDEIDALKPEPPLAAPPPPSWRPSAPEVAAAPELLRGGEAGELVLRFSTPEAARIEGLDDVFVDVETEDGETSTRVAEIRAVASKSSEDGLRHELTLSIFGKDVARRGEETLRIDVSVPMRADGRAFDAELETFTLPTRWGLPNVWDWVLTCAGAALFALLTPCVFPMIPVTVSYFTKQADADRRHPIVMPGLYVIGIIVSFVAIGTLFTIFFKNTGAQLLATNPWVQGLFGVLFIVFALSLFGVFALRPPAFLMAKAGAVQGKGGVIGVLGMGLLFSLTSFTCTAPLVGLILVTAAESGEWMMPVIGMTAFSAVLAAPFFFLALFPKLMSSLPRSGGWLNEVKVTLGFLELAFALKFLGVMDASFGWGILTREAILWIWAILFVLNGLYVLGVVRFEADAQHRRTGPVAGLAAVVLVLFGLHLTTGARGAPMPPIVESLMPPPIASDRDPRSDGTATTTASAGRASDGGARLGWANHERFRNDPEGAFAAAREMNVPVLIDFTGVT